MGLRDRFLALAVGTDPRLRRMLQYWAATAMLYAIFVILMGLEALAGTVTGAGVAGLALYICGGSALSYLLIRTSGWLRLAPTTLSTLQGLFAISCNMWGYSISGPLRGASLMGLMVVVVFCTFALRPRQTLLLALCGLLGMGATMWWHQARDPLHFPPHVEAVTFTIMAACSLAVTFLTGEMTKLRARLTAQKADLQTALETIRTLATTDELTALANRRHMNAVLAQQQQQQQQAGAAGTACVALLDIDFFKHINDNHGHAAGDAVLRGFAALLRAGVRQGDVPARWGGEEFLLLLPDTAPDQALALLERIRADAGASPLPGVDPSLRVSFSGGISARRGDEPFSATINRADKALYRAKAAGRDRVLVD